MSSIRARRDTDRYPIQDQYLIEMTNNLQMNLPFIHSDIIISSYRILIFSSFDHVEHKILVYHKENKISRSQHKEEITYEDHLSSAIVVHENTLDVIS